MPADIWQYLHLKKMQSGRKCNVLVLKKTTITYSFQRRIVQKMEDLKNYPLLFLKHCSDLSIAHSLHCRMFKIQVCEINSLNWKIKKNSKNAYGLVFHLTKNLQTYLIFLQKRSENDLIYYYYIFLLLLVMSLKIRLGAWNLKAPIAFKTVLDQEQLGAFIVFAMPSFFMQNDLVSLFYYSKKTPEV